MSNFGLLETQTEFGKLLRQQSDSNYFDKVEERRLQVYRDLFFNNIKGLLGNGFPVVKEVLGEERWKELLGVFWQEHRCQTPYFPRIGCELVAWMQQCQPAVLHEFPFLLELAHYELIEVVVDTADIQQPELTGKVEDLREQTLLLINPVSELLHYDYPVHQISKDYMPADFSKTEKNHLLVYRRRDHRVKFMQLSPASVLLVDLLQTQARTLTELIQITEQTMDAAAGSLAAHITDQVRDFIEREVIFI